MKKILFIEDESSLQKILGDVLGNEGFEVIAALNAEVGLREAKEQKPDLIILDLMLPGMHGTEALRKLKEKEETKSIPVIVLTNSEDMKDIQEAIELGAASYLVKSNYELKELIDKVKEALAR